jgi:hypothetical protein
MDDIGQGLGVLGQVAQQGMGMAAQFAPMAMEFGAAGQFGADPCATSYGARGSFGQYGATGQYGAGGQYGCAPYGSSGQYGSTGQYGANGFFDGLKSLGSGLMQHMAPIAHQAAMQAAPHIANVVGAHLIQQLPDQYRGLAQSALQTGVRKIASMTARRKNKATSSKKKPKMVTKTQKRIVSKGAVSKRPMMKHKWV